MVEVQLWVVLVCMAVTAGVGNGGQQEQKPPNVVVLLADDLGIGDLGCYGNTTINTPNIDRLSNEGVRLTHHLAAAASCTPSRAALLTARYPSRYGLVGEEGTTPVIYHVASRVSLPRDEVTLAKALSAANYTTIAVGKWHLGQMCKAFGRGCRGPHHHGFQSFYGLPGTLIPATAGSHPFWIFPKNDPTTYLVLSSLWMASVLALGAMCWRTKLRGLVIGVCVVTVTLLMAVTWFMRAHYRLHTRFWWMTSPWVMQHLNSLVMEDETVVEQTVMLEGFSQRLVNRSLKFIADHANERHPFFLYHSFGHVHTPMYTAPHMAGRSKHGRYGDNVEEMDAGVGEILAALSRHGLDNNTIVYFVSDNGAHLEAVDKDGQRVGGYNGLFKGGKSMGGAEGGIRVPGIYRWPGRLPAGVTVDTPTSLLDTLPTVLHLAGLPPLPDILPHLPHRELDGVSIAELLTSGTPPESRVFLHHCDQAIHALRLVQDKAVYKMHLFGHKWPPGSTQCGWGVMNYCQCYGDTVEDYGHQPLLFDLLQDPYEDHPIPTNTTRYKQVTEKLKQFLAEWRARLPYPPSQFRSVGDTVLLPWLQPFRW